MATLQQRLNDLASAIGADIKSLNVNQGLLSGLSTSAKNNLVAAINEIYGMLGSAGAHINDAATNGNTTETWSADKIFDTIEAAKSQIKNDLTAGAATALDTLNELAAALNNDPNFSTTIATAITNRLRFDDTQTLTAQQKTQACANLGLGEPDTDFLAIYVAGKA